ncbi:MAG: serine hydrolase [Lachnospiraceae bacterium]
MEVSIEEKIRSQLEAQQGKISFLYKNLISGKRITFQENLKMEAASVIKIPIMVEAFRQIEGGRISGDQTYKLREEDKRPSCGILNRLHGGIELTNLDLINMMITLSDNTATNILIELLGMEQINLTMKDYGLCEIEVNRLLFDPMAKSRGIENYVSAANIGWLLEQMYGKNLISGPASIEMLDILKEQRLNGKIPFFFKEKIDIAHKTGEDDGITHDVGIVFGNEPFLICFLGNETNTPSFERLMQEITWELYVAGM